MHWKVFLAIPTPLMFTHLANHMWTATVLLNPNFAVLADSNYAIIGLSPVLILFVDFALTRLPLMTRVEAFEAIYLFAI